MNELSLKDKTEEIKQGLSDLKSRICSGDESELLLWVIPHQLACAHRPLRYHPEFGGSGKDLPKDATEAILEWAKRIKGCGIRSIITLMHPKELDHYNALDLDSGDLLEFYRKQGFNVCHIPWEDPAYRPPSGRFTYKDELSRVRSKALDEFDNLPKPVLLHCSAGQDRSAPVAAYIFIQRRTE
jgi:hypothetical protein